MNAHTNNSLANIQNLDKIESNDAVEIGKWYILDKTKTDLFYYDRSWKESTEVTTADGGVLVCADSFESNLVVLKSNGVEYRVLNNNLGYALTCVTEQEAQALIEVRGRKQQTLIIEAQAEIKEVIAQINMSGAQQSGSTELIVATENALLEQSRALKEVHGKRIEELNNSVKKYVEDLHEVTKYYALPAMVGISKLGMSKNIVDEKLRELSLYGGLKEKEIIVSEGGVASEDKPVHIYQNLKYMDVECILGYQSGGIGVNSVQTFNSWLAEPVNRNRVMPTDKSIVAITVRKYPENKGWVFSDRKIETYLYMRNGENIKAVKTDLVITGTLLATENDFSHSFYAKKIGSWNDMSANFVFLSKNEYESLSLLSEQLKPLYLNTLLDSYRLRLEFLVAAAAYGEHKLNMIGESTEGKKIIVNSGFFVDGCRYGQAGFHGALEAHNEEIESVKADIKTITNCIKNGFTNPKIELPNSSIGGFGILNIQPTEIGFIDQDGVQHLMQISDGHYKAKLREIREKFDSMGLHFPNKNKGGHSERSNNPFSIIDDLAQYDLINDSHYFFDDIKALGWERYKRQNDLAILIQGLFDRGTFFGYTKVSLFQEGFDAKIKLVHDLDKGLYDGDMPDFKSYLANGRLDSEAGDIFFGHRKLWDEEQNEKSKDQRFYDHISIPKYLKADSIIKKRDGRTTVKFKWQTEHPYWSKAKTPARNNAFECDINKLINVSHYKLNDCKPYTKDPRCRDLYPEWGEFMMAAEAYHQEGSIDE